MKGFGAMRRTVAAWCAGAFVCLGVAHAQFGRGAAEWSTSGGDAHRSSSVAARYWWHNICTAAGVSLADRGTKRTLRSPLGRISITSLSRLFHSPESPDNPPWARACRRRITSGVTATGFFREKIQFSAVRYPASSSSERSRGLARPMSRGRSRSAGTVTPSIRFDDSALWMMACSRRTSRTSGFCLIQRSCFPRASMHAPRSQPVPTGTVAWANLRGSSVSNASLLCVSVA